MSADELPKQYDHASAQQRWYAYWRERGCFNSDPDPQKKPFTIVIPPPNVTGALHLGHALNNTLQDSLIRFKRMQGFNALWMPGTDHAGIATQAIVEKRLREQENKTRHDLGREKLVERIWQWKDEYEKRILGQLQQMGSSCDWRRTRFTLDPMCARAVRRTFFRLFRDGLVYRGKRLVNWDTFLQTAVSDDEVEMKSIKGNFWHLKYPVIDPQPGEPDFVAVATTRPETMLGDTAVAVHPDPAAALDKVEAELKAKLASAPASEKGDVEKQLADVADRRVNLLPQLLKLRDMAKSGRQVMLPLQNRPIPLVADLWAKPQLGSGCVKITPAHDPNDYEVGKRQNLPMINILNRDGTLNEEAGAYRGLTIPQARKKVTADLETLGLLTDVEDREIELPHSDRSKTPIEPFLADQWFVKMASLAQSAMDAVTDGRVQITPSRYAKSYLDWLGEKRDWPIGRQLWWGHRIPIWYCEACPESELEAAFAGRDDVSWSRDEAGDRWMICAEEADLPADAVPGRTLVQDDEVLDTWFSSALWPHSTLGWPESTPELAYYYPTSVLITSRDIITLWVARMVMTGLYNVGDVPFHQVYIHPKILDGDGDTMSKSKGNGVDPLDVIDKHGADALRFALAYLATETQDVRMPVDFECPHCGHLFAQTKQNRVLAALPCPKCQQKFSTQWATSAEDKALPRGVVTSERFDVARNFCNKLWNASRFALLNLDGYTPGAVRDSELTLEDKWLLSRLETVRSETTAALEEFRFADAARVLYEFAWDEFCSFYVEMVKTRLQDDSARPAAQRVLAHALDVLLRLLHPYIPFLTEEVWHLLARIAPERGLRSPSRAAETIMLAPWPAAEPERQSAEMESRFRCFEGVLRGLREVRSRQQIPPKETLEFLVKCDTASQQLLEPMTPYFESMAGAKPVRWGADVTAPATSASFAFQTGPRDRVSAAYEVFVDLQAFLDLDKEIAKKEKELKNTIGQIASKNAKLANEKFVSSAPADVVQRERDSLVKLQEQQTSLEAALASLKEARASKA